GRLFRRAICEAMLGRRDWLEILMRLTPFILCLGLAASTLPVAVVGQRPDDQIAPQSMQLLKQGETLLVQGKLNEADDGLETALVVDPKNRAAFTAMARVAIKEKLYGQAIKLTNKALALEPTDRDAIAFQGEGMVELGALPRAKENLAKLQKLCGNAGCPQVAVLSTAIAKGPALAAAKTPDVPKKNGRRPGSPRPARRGPLQESAWARATNSSTLTVSARRSGSIPRT